MKELRQFFEDFFKSDGKSVFLSLLIGKICAFATSLLIIRTLPVAEFGNISLVLSWFSIFASFVGLGLPSSLLRFGSLENYTAKREQLAAAVFWRGFFPQLICAVLFFLICLFYLKESRFFAIIFLAFSVRLIGVFLMSHIQADLRINHDNRGFSNSSNLVNIGGFVLMLILTNFFGISGYLFSAAFAPFLSVIWLKKSHIKQKHILNSDFKSLRNYGILSSFTALLSDALFSADILLLGFFCSSDVVAGYRVAILIPSNLAFLAIVFMQTDFPKIAKNFENKAYLLHYFRNYYRIFLPLAFFIFIIGFAFKTEIIKIFFGEKYLQSSTLFTILLAAYCFNFLTRNFFGNMLPALGEMKINTIISAFSLTVLILFGALITPVYGESGMAYSILITFLLSGLTYSFVFLRYILRLN